jgi:hypothetical protein
MLIKLRAILRQGLVNSSSSCPLAEVIIVFKRVRCMIQEKDEG